MNSAVILVRPQRHAVARTVSHDLTTTSQQKSSGGSITVGTAGVSGSVNAGKSNINSQYTSVTEQSGLRAGDGGFNVNVQGNTRLVGGAITSTQAAIDQNRNTFQTAGQSAQQAINSGTLTLSDIHNQASYSASSSSVNLGTGFSPQGKLTPQGTGAGWGKDSGQASSVTQSAISGMAGNTAARTGDAETGINKIFDADRVQKEINAQTQITQLFLQQAPKAAAEFANNKEIQLRQEALKAEQQGQTERAQALKQEAERWADGGAYRIGLHAATGALAGGLDGALGAGTSAGLTPILGEKIAELNLPEPVRQGLTQVTGTLIGASVGGTAGAATALGETANNYLSRSPFANVRRTANQENARLLNQCGTSCTEADFRRIDAQVAKVEQAATLAEISQRNTLTPQQAQQLTQVLLELLPVYGTGESLTQLITGKSSVTQEEASRLWAAVGMVPVAGGLLKLGVKEAKALMEAGAAVKPLQTGGARGAAHAASGAELRAELVELARIMPDTSKDAEYLAKTDLTLIKNNNFDFNHVLSGEMNAKGKATGYHAEFAAEGAARIRPGSTVTVNADSTYSALVDVWDASKNTWVEKVSNEGKSTFFPTSWSQARIQYEVSEAFKNRRMITSTQWRATSPSGIEIQGYVNAGRVTFYPLGK